MNPAMDLAMTGYFVSPIITFLITKLSTYCYDEIARACKAKSDLEKLAQTLEQIGAVLHDAEKQQVLNQEVNRWLEKLKDVAYDAEDVLIELGHKDLEHKMKIIQIVRGFNIAPKIQRVNAKLDEITKDMKKFKFSNQLGCSASSTVMREKRSETSSLINDSAAVVGRKDDVSNILDLLSDCNQESYSVVRIHGMGGIGKTTLAQLVWKELDDDIYKDRFEIKRWVCVSRQSDVKEIFGDLVLSLDPKFNRQSNMDVIKSYLKSKLMEKKCLMVLDDVWMNHGIDVKELLKDLLSISCQGSKILMTMRSAEDIPPMTDCRYIVYQLQGLPKDDCWSIIKKTAFAHGGAEETADLINIGMEIASKCGGLPLAAKTLGGLLYSKKNEEEWLSILDSQFWDLATGEDNIISILKLSYHHLSPYVKRCFSYCSLFPKGHTFSKKELILMWMAEGFLDSPRKPNTTPEIVGKDYLKILLLNSFFQDEERMVSELGDIKFCRMHDLVHDLGISVSGSEYRVLKIPTDADQEVTEQLRRLGLHDVSEIPSEIFYKASKLRTLCFFNPKYDAWAQNYLLNEQIFNFSFLRVVKLSHTAIKELPKLICKLKYIRYLDLSYTGITTFPTSFNELHNLQTLRLKECNLRELPRDMTKLISLEYFKFSGVSYGDPSFTQMPREVSRLSKLKKLSVFIVGKGKGYGIEELKDLNLLGGKLVITNLERVTDAAQANLKGKKNITHLQLHWNSQICRSDDDVVYDDDDDDVVSDDDDDDDSSNTSKDSDSITKDANDLQPHRYLKKIEIYSFGGSNLPTWMMSTSIHLPNLVYITLDGCNNCEHLPAVGRLRSLRYLYMSEFHRVKHIGDEFYQSNGEASFPSLVELHLDSFKNLEEWFGDQRAPTSSFPCLESLQISFCYKLSTTPTIFPSLKNLAFSYSLRPNVKFLPLKLLRGTSNVIKTLWIDDSDLFEGFLPDDEVQKHDDLCNNFLSWLQILRCPSLTRLPADFRGLNSLTRLAIQYCGSLTSLPDGIQYLPALRTLIIGGFSSELESFPFPAATGADGEQYFVSLRELEIHGWFPLRDVLPGQIQHITSLQSLNISYWDDLFSLPEWLGKLSSLQTLEIEECEDLSSLPSEEQWEQLTSLQILNIRGCPLLIERCRAGNEESHKIAHFNLTKGSPCHSIYERMGDIPLMKSRKGKEKLSLH